MNIAHFVALAFGLGIISAIMWGVANFMDRDSWASWLFALWLAFLCISTAKYFMGV